MRATVLLLALLAAGCGEANSERPASPDDPVQAPARTTEPADPVDPADCERLARRLDGRTLEDAQRSADERGCPLRVIERDGQALPVTEDFSPARINVRVAEGRIVGVDGLY